MRTSFKKFIIVTLLSSGCSKIPPSGDDSVSSVIESRTHSFAEWRRGCDQDACVQDFINDAISQELTAEIAIQVALLNNPKIQASFEELGIARANLIEAGLLSNPAFEVEVRYPHESKFHTNIEYLITSTILDIFLIPLRTRLASTEFEQTKLTIAKEILNLAFEVREVFYELIAANKKTQYLESILELTEIISTLSSDQLHIGNINVLDFQLSQAHLLEARSALAVSQTEVIRFKEKLNRLLGFSEDACLIVIPSFPEIEPYAFNLCDLEQVAIAERLDLQTARLEIVHLSQMVGLKEWWSYSNLQFGLAGEREPEGSNFLGPSFAGTLPIFNYGQAARMRIFGQIRQAQDRLCALEIAVLSEVREAHKILINYLTIIKDYQERILPMQAKITQNSSALYNVMGLGIHKLLENKRQEVVAEQNYVEIVKKYFIARVELDRALGGYLSMLMPGVCP